MTARHAQTRRAWRTRHLGTWQSDRRHTFRHFRPRPGSSPAQLRKFKGLFGHLLLRWTPQRLYDVLKPWDDRWQWQPYELVACNAESTVIRTVDALSGGTQRLYQLLFESHDRYWIHAWTGLPEAFRRVR